MANEIKPIASTDILQTDVVVGNLMSDLRQIIDEARIHVASTANYELTMMYWHIGERINRDVLGNERAEYGKQIVSQVATQLQALYGSKGFEIRNVRRMMQFAQQIKEEKIVSQLATKLSWSHFIEVLPLKDELQREFYLTLAANELWGRNRLRKEIDAMLYERTALASKPEEVVKQELANVRDNKHVSPDVVFKSPYFLEFTGLKGMYSEKDLEDSLVAHLEQFILELGNGFCFAERQKRMIIDSEDFYLDLLFYHRKLHRLIAIDLKLGRFKAQYKGQMELYLRWLEQNEMEPGEETPLGLLLCTEGSEEQIELLQLDKSGIKVAQYMTELPPRDLLVQQIQKSLEVAKAKWGNEIKEDEV
ncbi:MAG: PDDEXK nuclease domain-containing protein [Paludibacteraceae bacterium]|nr:PDDEXK nuclease domain-containing protein [Paludibacteraceae bacterium]